MEIIKLHALPLTTKWNKNAMVFTMQELRIQVVAQSSTSGMDTGERPDEVDRKVVRGKEVRGEEVRVRR